ncbi:MAG: sodium/solute symporter [Planctomycetes bacterium]|nr:sodium/solute symporter [Planctomycetota bacterium]
MTGLVGLDWAVIAAYFAGIAAVGWWSSRHQESSADYFLASRNAGWFIIGGSLFATNIGSEHIVGLAGSGAESGMAMAHYELHAWCILVLGWVFVPFYWRAAVFTTPEFLEKRYNSTVRWILSVVSLVAYVFTKVSVTVYAGGVVFNTLLPAGTFGRLDNFWVGAATTVVATGIYTVFGGLRAVLWTDTAMVFVLLTGSLCITAIGLNEVGGWGELRRLLSDTQHFNMWRPASDPEYPWAGMLFGAPIVGMWYWCTDQYIVQRTLAARNMQQARRGTIWGAYLKLTPVFLFIVPGMIAFALAKQGKITLAHSDQAFPVLVQALLGPGLRGLVVAGLLAALMSSLSSLFNSAATLFTVDIYEKLRPGRSERELVRVGRIATAVVVLLGIAWIPVMRFVAGGLYQYLQRVQAYLGPPITAVFFLGIFIRRVNGAGALAGLVCGFLLGMAKLAAQVLAGIEPLSEKLPPWLVAFGKFNFLYFCLVLFAVSVVTVVVVSLLTSRPPEEKLKGLTYATVTAEGRDEARRSWGAWEVVHTLIILGAIAAVYLYFTG